MEQKYKLLDIKRYPLSGNRELDQQQLLYIEYCNDYFKAFNNGTQYNIIETTLTYLADYCKKHFMTQEAYMELYSYPDIEAHIVKHSQFLREIAKCFKQYIEYKRTQDRHTFYILSMSVGSTMLDWFESHILQDDRRVNEYIRFETT